MSVHSLRPDLESRPPKFFVPAIRTPTRFAQAQNCLYEILDSIDFHCSRAEIVEKISQVRAIREAMDTSPFYFQDGCIKNKGFTPRIVS